MSNLESLIKLNKKERKAVKNAKEVTIQRTGDALSVPNSMSLDDAIAFLTKKRDEEEQPVAVLETIDAYPFDAAYSFYLVMQEVFGFSGQVPKQTMFGPRPPMFITVPISATETVQVPWGVFELPGIEGQLETNFNVKNSNIIFQLAARVKGKHKLIIQELGNAIREKLKTNSIYRGKAIKVTFRDDDGERIEFDIENFPTFMKLDGGEQPIFTKSTQDQIETSIINPIRFTDRCKRNGMKIKRHVLLEGDFGTGKTLTALQTARECVKHGWTFLYVDDCRDLGQAMKLAEQYSPTVVFAEDVDLVMSGQRNSAMNELSCVLDGVDNKNKEVMLILTTNNVDHIERLMLRPGRIDTVVKIEAPDTETAYRLMDYYSKGKLVGKKEDFERAIKPMIGQNPAFLAEVVSKAELHSIALGEDITITPEGIGIAVQLMQNHVKLMNQEVEHKSTTIPINKLNVLVQNGNSTGNLVKA